MTSLDPFLSADLWVSSVGSDGGRMKTLRMRAAGAAVLLCLLTARCDPSKAPEEQSHNPQPSEEAEEDEFLGSSECLAKKWTRASCDLVFCQPWERCVDGRCSCKQPYMCPIDGTPQVCGLNGWKYRSYCLAMALSCRSKKSEMSHFGDACEENSPKFQSSTERSTGAVQIFMPSKALHAEGQRLLVCWELWDMAAANVFCRQQGHPLGASNISFTSANSSCVSVRCQGFERSLAECVIHDPTRGPVHAARTTCYDASKPKDKCDFRCANDKCVSKNQTCDGVDDCGDRSDEMCCKKCRSSGFRCRTGVCVHRTALRDGQVDCLDAEDESPQLAPSGPGPSESEQTSAPTNTEFTSPKEAIRLSRRHLETQLHCGIPNKTTVDSGEHIRVKRVIGGVPAKPTQIQWQIALDERRKIDCGGAYIGGCWVITAAHCVRPNPSAFRVKFSLWKKSTAQKTTDIVPVKEIFIHPKYNGSNYQNDIALIRLENLPRSEKCLEDNPAVSAICVPWTTQLFQPNHTCSISGWGRTAAGKGSQTLLWANVSLIEGCQAFYKERFRPGMMCAGDVEGNVDSCQGDSGGPLVCEDELGVSYLWGVVSWGERCGQPGFPGVYTQVAQYFEWIRLHTGWAAVTRFNS
ncbi:complement factor I [Betta splendens]|uniref:trypsin n=1 Tax=Betta splendens TaxID=158456 RepID=A0A6P7LWY7_BETSP|nr:complement factor I [Betta splendens]